MKYLAILLLSAVGFVAAASFGEYVPKAYFYIDENGNPSPVYPINTDSLTRNRRQVQPFQPFGQPAFGFPQFPQIQPGQGSGTFTSSSQTLSSRFGEDEPVVTGQSTIVHQTGNKVTQTNTYLRPDGTTYTNQQSGRVKRQQSQTQSQKGQGGSQIQSQTQDGPGGQQHQTQSQGQNLDPISAPAGQHVPQDNTQQYAPQGGEQQYAPQGGEQQYAPQTENRNQPSYPQPQANYQPGFAPFGFGAFGPAGFPQQGFGFPQQGFGGVGFGQPGFGAPGFGFPQAGFGGVGFGQPGFVQPGPGTTFTGSRIDSRFSEDDDVGGTSGGTTTFTSNNGVFHSTSSVLGPDGKVITRHSTGKL